MSQYLSLLSIRALSWMNWCTSFYSSCILKSIQSLPVGWNCLVKWNLFAIFEVVSRKTCLSKSIIRCISDMLFIVLCGDKNVTVNHLKTCVKFNIISLISVIFKYTLFSEVDRISLQVMCLPVNIIQIMYENLEIEA